jgi:hypothetical protein
MKALPALRLLAVASLISFVGATKASAQLFYHVYDFDSAHVDSNNNLGVAVDIKFDFNVVDASHGTLTLTIFNLAGQSKTDPLHFHPEDGLGNYTTGILTGFGFDLPGNLVFAGFFNNSSTTDPNGVFFAPVTPPYDETSPQGDFDFGASTTSPKPIEKGIAGGESAVFEIKFTGDMATYFNASFFENNAGSDADFGFRFQAIPGNIGSDKFVYYENPPIPEPSTYGIFAAVLLVGMITGKRVRAQKKALV